MASVIKIVDRQTVEAEAAAWLAQLDGGKLSPADHAAFREWVGRSPDHRKCLTRMARMWSGMDELIEARIAEAMEARAEKTRGFGLAGALAQLYPARAAAAFTLLFCAVALSAVMIAYGPFGAHAPEKAVYAAAIGEQKELTLDDGSVVRLNTGSSVEVDFSAEERSVRLLDGEAWFDVAHDEKIPFVVYAGDGAVRAIGTSFAVRKRDDVVDVTVTEGRVVLSTIRRDDNGGEPLPYPLATLEAGHQASFDEQVESVGRLETEEIERRLSWREGFLTFDGEALGDVVTEISRYTTVDIIIDDERLRDLRVGGYFQTGDIDTMLEVLEQSFGVAHRWDGKEIVRLTSAG
ncbi:FecR family protein [Hyphococcus sp.]|uniref:FecR family protein n=1 Tax=Hyphococcus sp. TaxID=2038636 RepID=UPI003D0E257B